MSTDIIEILSHLDYLRGLTKICIIIITEFQLTLFNIHSYVYLVLNLDWSPNTACVEIICPTILAMNLTLKSTIPLLYFSIKLARKSLSVSIRFVVILRVSSVKFQVNPNQSNFCTGVHIHFSSAIWKPNCSRSDLIILLVLSASS